MANESGLLSERRRQQITQSINTVQTSSLGRVFDAIGALTGLGSYNNFEAQLPIRLESVIDSQVADSYGFEIASDSGGTLRFDFRSMVHEIVDDVSKGTNVGTISAKFHNCIADVMVEFAIRGRQMSGLNTVALSGGVFCNRYLANRTIRLLKENNFCVLFNRIAPVNDGSIALGQAAIAAKAVSRGTI
jgi:hydrogenase maturation protein HypF